MAWRLEERLLLGGGAWRHEWHEDYHARDRAMHMFAVLAHDTSISGMYGPAGPRQLVVKAVDSRG